MQPTRKIEKLKAAASVNDWRTAIAIAARFPNLGAEKRAITQAWEAYVRPEFQKQIGRDPDALISAGINALRAKYHV